MKENSFLAGPGRRMLLTVAAITLAVPLAACGGSDPVPPSGSDGPTAAIKKGGTLRVSLSGDPGNLDPTRSNMLGSYEMYPLMCEALYGDMEEGLVPILATADPVISEDKKSAEVTIRSDAVFADGTKLDAEAVRFSLDRHKTLPTSQRATELAFMKDAEVVNDTTLRLNLTAPVAPGVIKQYLANRAGTIMSPTAVKKLGADGFNAAPVCSGPFKFESRVAQTSVTVVKDPNYYDADKVNLDAVKFVVIPQAAVRMNNLLAGDLDVTAHVNPTDAKAMLEDSGVTSHSFEGNGFFDIIVNIANDGSNKPGKVRDTPMAKSADLRKAFSLAINRDAINQSVYSGGYGIACTFMPPHSEFATERNTACPKFDPEEAKRLVAASGYPTPIKVSLLLNQTTEFSQMAQLIQQMVKEVGFDLTLDVQETTTCVQRTQTGEFDVYMNTWTGTNDAHQNVNRFFYSTETSNMARLPDPELDGLLAKASQETDKAARAGFYDQIAERLAAETPTIYLVRPAQIVVHSKKVSGLQYRSSGSIVATYAGFTE